MVSKELGEAVIRDRMSWVAPIVGFLLDNLKKGLPSVLILADGLGKGLS